MLHDMYFEAVDVLIIFFSLTDMKEAMLLTTIKRNIDRFPEDFMFQLKPEELPESLKSQNVILNESGNRRGMHIKKMPNAFTEQLLEFTVVLVQM